MEIKNDPKRYEEYKKRTREYQRKYRQRILSDPKKSKEYRNKMLKHHKLYNLERKLKEKVAAGLQKVITDKNESEIKQKLTPKEAKTAKCQLEKVERFFELALPYEEDRRRYIKELFLERRLKEMNDIFESRKKKNSKKFVNTQDMLQIKQENEHDYFDSINDAYCRCCFKIFTFDSSRVGVDENLHHSICEAFQINFNLNFGSTWICEACHLTVINFQNFKNEISLKQAQFEIMLNKNEHEDLMEIQKLAELNAENNFIEENNQLEEITIKEEVMDASTYVIKELSIPDIKPPVRVHKTPKISDVKSQCKDCKGFYKNLLAHRIKQHNKIVFCSICGFKTDTNIKLSKHTRIKHPLLSSVVRKLKAKEEQNYTCDLCPFSSHRKFLIIHHMRSFHLTNVIKY